MRSHPDALPAPCCNEVETSVRNTIMYIGGGLIGTLLVIALIVWVVRRV